MANDHNYRQEPTKTRQYPCIDAVAINIGDLVWYDSAAASIKKASAMTFVSEALQQEEFARKFAGVALKQSLAVTDFTKTDPVSVATSGIFEMACDATTFVIGDLVGCIDNAAPDALENQKVKKVTASNLAIGRVVLGGTSLTKVSFEIFPALSAPVAGASRDEYFEKHIVTSAENTANLVNIDTGFGTSPSYFTWKLITVATGIENTTSVYSEPSPGTIRIADGSTVLATSDIILFYARR